MPGFCIIMPSWPICCGTDEKGGVSRGASRVFAPAPAPAQHPLPNPLPAHLLHHHLLLPHLILHELLALLLLLFQLLLSLLDDALALLLLALLRCQLLPRTGPALLRLLRLLLTRVRAVRLRLSGCSPAVLASCRSAVDRCAVLRQRRGVDRPVAVGLRHDR